MSEIDIRPGEFRDASGEAEFPKGNTHTREPQIYFAGDLISIYSAFRNQIYNPSSVLYPSCGFDASPARVFSNVTFVDKEEGNERCVSKLQEAGLNALKQDIRKYHPKNVHDLLILLNPSIPTEWASKHLKSGGYILANNYHGNATEMYGQPDQFDLWGTIDFVEKNISKGDNRVVISRNLEGLFEPVANEEELKRFRPEYYEFLGGVFRAFALNMRNFNADRPFEEVWADYREMMQEGMPSKKIADRYVFVKK